MLQGGARGLNLGHLFLFFLNGIIHFKEQALFRIDFLSVTSEVLTVWFSALGWG